jgi:hypothetical protein
MLSSGAGQTRTIIYRSRQGAIAQEVKRAGTIGSAWAGEEPDIRRRFSNPGVAVCLARDPDPQALIKEREEEATVPEGNSQLW